MEKCTSSSLSILSLASLTNHLKGLFFFLYPGVLKDVTTHFIVDARSLSKVGGNHVKVTVINPSGTNTDAFITDKGDGTYRVEYTAFEDGRSKVLHTFSDGC